MGIEKKTAGQVVTRFAPSPTGALHVGGARTALFNWAFARQQGGRFILRMEDTDRARSSDASARSILADLRWLGIDWDEGPACLDDWREVLGEGFDVYGGQVGEVGPYFQSERMAAGIYDRYIEKLMEAGRAYEDGGAVRFKMPSHEIVVNDLVLGEVRVPAGQTEDFVIRKGDGFPTYHFAVVVDDALMGVTHVIRGQEHLSNAPKHVGIYEAIREVCGDEGDGGVFAEPVYAHIPLIFNPDGSKMSKRDRAKAAREGAKKWLDEGGDIEELVEDARVDADELKRFLDKQNDDEVVTVGIADGLGLRLPEINVGDFRGSGYLSGVICNYLALLGWNPGEDVEKFDNALLVERFGFDRVQRSAAKFDREKLASFNGDAIAEMAGGALATAVWGLPVNHTQLSTCGMFEGAGDPRFVKFVEMYRPRSKTLRDPVEQGWFFLVKDDEIRWDWEDKGVVKAMVKADWEGLGVLRLMIEERVVESVNDAEWEAGKIEAAVKGWAEGRGLGMGKVAQPLRVAVSGGVVSPPIFETLEVLGRGSVLFRMDACLASGEAARIGGDEDEALEG